MKPTTPIDNQALARFPSPGEVRLVRLLPGPIERVWDFITDPEKRARWFCGGLLEPKAGGKFVFAMHHKHLAPDETPPAEYAKVHHEGVSFEGRVLQCEPPRLLVFTFGSDDSIVTFDLKPEGDKVRLLLIHRASGADLKDVGSFAAGWHIHWGMLIALLEGSPHPQFWGQYARLKPLYCQMTSTDPRAGCISTRS
ncbi:MAG TPA: SRPBCC family protein [Rariglobus sp.]